MLVKISQFRIVRLTLGLWSTCDQHALYRPRVTVFHEKRATSADEKSQAVIIWKLGLRVTGALADVGWVPRASRKYNCLRTPGYR